VKVLFLDDDPDRHAEFDRLAKGRGYDVVHVWSATEAREALAGEQFAIVYLDRDLTDHRPAQVGFNETNTAVVVLTGEHVARYIVDMPRSRRPVRVVIHSWNPDAGRRMRDVLLAAGVPSQYRPLGDPRCGRCQKLISHHRGDNRATLVCP
jgi:CheY-like chemotaxis protein